MARRGDKLREHILWTAKDVFLEMGFERASMDVVASRAETSKRSLYAHFESKEKLFLAARNLPHVEVMAVGSLDPVSLVKHEKVIATVGALRMLEQRLGGADE